ncbi:MAG: iron ABC transporter permease [Proteobacteria bacterium]|jgi:predicted secreted hydrolase|nr:iron ABC transporter permease [Pseudomonadota bacterium]
MAAKAKTVTTLAGAIGVLRMSFRFPLLVLTASILLWLIPGHAQSDDPYAFLRSSNEGSNEGSQTGYAEVIPGQVIEFPRDHGSHPEFRIEWWYVTANVEDADGKQFGVQWTLFRRALLPASGPAGGEAAVGQGKQWQSNQVWLAHTAITNASEHKHWQKMARGGIGQAGVRAHPFDAWIDHWSLSSMANTQDDVYPLELSFSAQEGDAYGVNLKLSGDTPIVLHGQEGYSQKSASKQASYYYSQPQLAVSGQIVWQGSLVKVTGQAWLDHEWSSQPLAANQSGWDWFALHLNDGRALMIYRMREEPPEGLKSYWLSGSLITQDGSKTNILGDEVILEVLGIEDVGGRTLPLRWRVLIPKYDIDLKIEPLHTNQFISGALPYWEGVVFATDSGTRKEAGRGYMELMGY